MLSGALWSSVQCGKEVGQGDAGLYGHTWRPKLEYWSVYKSATELQWRRVERSGEHYRCPQILACQGNSNIGRSRLGSKMSSGHKPQLASSSLVATTLGFPGLPRWKAPQGSPQPGLQAQTSEPQEAAVHESLLTREAVARLTPRRIERLKPSEGRMCMRRYIVHGRSGRREMQGGGEGGEV